MTTFFLIRHASHDLLGRALAGRSEVPLNAQGEEEAERLPERLAGVELHACVSSPALRARQTAASLAARQRLEVQTHEGIGEIDFGGWTGRTFRELEGEPEWSVWVQRRSAARPPHGESIPEVQRRAVRALEELASACGGQRICLFSHGDVIKAALAHFLEMSLDHLERFDIAPASISVVAMDGAWARVQLVNETGTLRFG